MSNNLDHTTPEGRELMRQAANKRTKKLELQKAKIIAEIIEISMVKFILDEMDGREGQSTITIQI